MSKPIGEYQRSFLLLQPLGTEDRKIKQSDANAALRTAAIRNGLGLSTKKANEIRGSLGDDGYLVRSRERTEQGGTANFYAITDKGIALLLGMEQYPLEIVIPGRAINALLAAANEARAQWSDQTVPDDLGPAIMEEFNTLKSEHVRTGLVPMYKVRERIAARFGDKFATHDCLDQQILRLWQQKRLQLVPITDLRGATQEQLDAGVHNGNHTFFYLEEPARESAAIG